MKTNRSRHCFALIAFVWLFSLSHAAHAKGDVTLKKQLTETIEKVRSGETSNIRDEAAQHLAQLTRGIDPNRVDDETVGDLVSLLDVPEARYWVAVCLGNLGPRAKIAVPKLQKILMEEDCQRVSMSAAGGIRYALKKLGIKPPPPACPNSD